MELLFICQWVDYFVLVQGKVQPLLAVAAQALENFVNSLDQEAKSQTEDHNSQEHQFILALAGTLTSKFRVEEEDYTSYVILYLL